jgi:hypothetical protein
LEPLLERSSIPLKFKNWIAVPSIFMLEWDHSVHGATSSSKEDRMRRKEDGLGKISEISPGMWSVRIP